MKHLILDIETTSIDPLKADLKIFGGYDVEDDRYFIIKYSDNNRQKIKDIIDSYDWIITFNGQLYDLIILERHKLKVPFYKHIDLYQVCKRRTSLVNKEGFKSFSLKNIIKTLQLDNVGKGDIDYNVFLKDDWTKEEQVDIVKYLKQDLLLTYKLWDYMLKRFAPFADFLDEKDVKKYKHIITSSGSYSYKVICKMAGIDEQYSDYDTEEESFIGAFVSAPSVENATGLIVDLDFASLYPSMFIQFNLYSHNCKCCTDEEKFKGNNMFIVKGKYCAKQQGRVEETLKKLYQLRKEYKKNKDNREYVVKIIINTMYGISGNKKFANLYNLNTASDCTALGQQCIKYARSRLNQEGYTVLYSDTDSAYVQVPNNKTLDDIKQLARNVSQEISNNTVFPWNEFDFKVDEIIKYICFFTGNDGELNKKHYLYVTQNDELVLKGIQLVKRNCSKLSVTIFQNELREQIIKRLNCKFDKKYITDLINKYLNDNIELAAVSFNVKRDYKSKTSIQNQIYEAYGDGEHQLIKNYSIGVGKGVKYCKLEDVKKLSINDIDIETFISELTPFIEQIHTGTGGLNDYI